MKQRFMYKECDKGDLGRSFYITSITLSNDRYMFHKKKDTFLT